MTLPSAPELTGAAAMTPARLLPPQTLHRQQAVILALGPETDIVVAASTARIRLSVSRPLRVVSSALVGGGLGWATDFVNVYVDRHYDCRAPQDDLSARLHAWGLAPAASIAMMTAVPLSRLAVAEASLGAGRDAAPDDCAGTAKGVATEPRVLVAATAGVGNAVDITSTPRGDPRLVAGTINTVVFIDAHLTDGALINACQSATEAKVRALAQHQVYDTVSGTLATGTSTDCLAIGATQRGEPTPYAGSGTRLGRAIGSAVFLAISASLQSGGA
ncbi:adenosylcobinamide amidohydrolase [Halomonas sp. V046]|uniref:adenosylcobinamide amidohydrolase n=1 Tax=Halomonas sp. V046 TaxID=3459611 RepID=UPI004043A241